jgi:tetraacyldisaccharide 4'-kinase
VIAPRFWAMRQPNWLARLLSPIGAIYGAATARRMAWPGSRVPAPVVCVGNFVVGGAGKTPTAIAVAKLLQASGERVAFLSRGYGGAARTDPLQVEISTHRARLVGDEPLLLARFAPCFVGWDRVAAAKAAIEAGAMTLIMDDGLQNPSLTKNVRFAVVDAGTLLGNGLCLPAGPLRAPIAAQLPFVDALIAIGGGAETTSRLRAITPEKPIFRAQLQPDAVAAAKLVGSSVLAFCGIAQPEKFFGSLTNLGARVAVKRVFADHHIFTPGEIDALIAEAGARGLTLVTTEKDHVRISAAQAPGILTLPVTLRFDAPDAFGRWLAAAVAAARFSGAN